jgi:hypothetical protein
MTSKKEETNNPVAPRKRRPPALSYSAPQKAQAVLAVWTERARPADVMRELKINWVMLQHWQQRAMEGMLRALEGRARLSDGTALPPRLQALLSKQETPRLAPRLRQVQQAAREPLSEG